MERFPGRSGDREIRRKQGKQRGGRRRGDAVGVATLANRAAVRALHGSAEPLAPAPGPDRGE